jgi:protocatechuate 3,4-dioxygenase beta subunit
LSAERENKHKEISRRDVIGILAVAGAGAMLGCGGGTKTSTTTTTTATTATGSTTTCTVTPEGEEGPYFVDDSATGFNRSDIRSNLDGTSIQTGIPLTLSVYVFDNENSCAAMQNVQVDIWQCNASGIYSAEDVESTTGETWLRGYQLTDVNGLVKFVSIVPGWYQGRTTHIHLRLRSTYDSTTDGGTNTTQLFFPQDTIDTINTTIDP